MSDAANGDLKICNREELIHALQCAAELEHMLCCEYLFTGWSVRRTVEDFDDLPSAVPIEKRQLTIGKTRDWLAQIYMIARQEMEHLGIVTNLLNAVGAAPYVARPNFPLPRERSLLDAPFCLDRFDRTSLKRFVWYEHPDYLTDELEVPGCTDAVGAGSIPPSPCSGLDIPNIQVLYEEINKAFQHLPPGEIFVGRPSRQVGDVFGYRIKMVSVTNREEVANAVNLIIEQGEGVGLDPLGSDSHFQRFVGILAEFDEAVEAGENCEPAFPVVSNPAVQQSREGCPANIIHDPDAVEVMKLFNDAYQLTLVMLTNVFGTQFTDYDPKPRCQAAVFYAAFFPLMTMVLRPLGEILVRMPAGKEYPGHTGASFEIHEPIECVTDLHYFTDCLRDMKNKAFQLRDVFDPDSPGGAAQWKRMNYLYENLNSTNLHVEHIWKHGN